MTEHKKVSYELGNRPTQFTLGPGGEIGSDAAVAARAMRSVDPSSQTLPPGLDPGIGLGH